MIAMAWLCLMDGPPTDLKKKAECYWEDFKNMSKSFYTFQRKKQWSGFYFEKQMKNKDSHEGKRYDVRHGKKH
jgi:hypothetical protein